MQKFDTHKYRWLLVAAITLIVLLFVLFVDVQAVLGLLLDANWPLWFGSAAFLLVGYALSTVRWRYLLAAKPAWLCLFCGDSIAYMINMITPIPVMVSRIVTTSWTTPVPIPQATSGIVIDRLLETMMRLIATFFLVALLATGQAEATTTILTNLGIIVFGIGGLVWVSKHQGVVVDKLAKWLGQLPHLSEEQIRKTVGALLKNLAYSGSTRQLLGGLIISIVMWIFFLVFQYLALSALQPPPTHPDRQILLTALVVLIIIPPSTTAMIGLYHSIVIGALVGFRLLDINTATAYAIILHLPQMGFWLLAGAWATNQSDIKYGQLMQAIKAHTSKESDPSKSGVSPIETSPNDV